MEPSAQLWAAMVGGIIGLAALALVLLRHRSAPGAVWLMLSVLACLQWGLAYLFELGAEGIGEQEFWGAVKYVGGASLSVTWLLFCLLFTGQVRRSPTRLVLVLLVEPVIVWGLLLFPGTRELVRYYPSPASTEASAGPLFWVHTVYVYVLLAAATVLLVVSLARMSRIYRWTSIALIASVVPPYAANLMFNLNVWPLADVDLTPFLFTVTALVLVLGLYRVPLPRLQPLARRQVFSTMREAVFVLDEYDRVSDANPAAVALRDKPVSRLLGRRLGSLAPEFSSLLSDSPGDRDRTDLVRLGDQVFEVVISPVRNAKEVVGRIVVLRDVTARHALQERLAWEAMHDPLTRLGNRRLLLDRMRLALARARRQQHEIGLLYLDLDHFKDVNDRYGHAAGDRLLATLAERIDLTVRETDTTARLGGDEFAVLLDPTAGEPGAVKAAENVISVVHDPIRLHRRVTRPDVSVGIAVGCPDDPEALLQAADSALYEAKREGGHRYVVRHLPRPRTPEGQQQP